MQYTLIHALNKDVSLWNLIYDIWVQAVLIALIRARVLSCTSEWVTALKDSIENLWVLVGIRLSVVIFYIPVSLLHCIKLHFFSSIGCETYKPQLSLTSRSSVRVCLHSSCQADFKVTIHADRLHVTSIHACLWAFHLSEKASGGWHNCVWGTCESHAPSRLFSLTSTCSPSMPSALVLSRRTPHSLALRLEVHAQIPHVSVATERLKIDRHMYEHVRVSQKMKNVKSDRTTLFKRLKIKAANNPELSCFTDVLQDSFSESSVALWKLSRPQMFACLKDHAS